MKARVFPLFSSFVHKFFFILRIYEGFLEGMAKSSYITLVYLTYYL